MDDAFSVIIGSASIINVRVELTSSWSVRELVEESIVAMRWSFLIIAVTIVIAVVIYQWLGLIPLSLQVASGIFWLVVITSVFSIVVTLIRLGISELLRRLHRSR